MDIYSFTRPVLQRQINDSFYSEAKVVFQDINAGEFVFIYYDKTRGTWYFMEKLEKNTDPDNQDFRYVYFNKKTDLPEKFYFIDDSIVDVRSKL